MTAMTGGATKLERSLSRRVFMVLSPRSLGYARLALQSLYRNCDENFHISLITDSEDDKRILTEELQQIAGSAKELEPSWTVHSALDVAQRESEKFASYEHIRNFRQGHPCWRKITDPILLSENGDEMIVLDPDIYFPNRFRFESTPQSGVYLMWQKPSCLLPPEIVEAAIEAQIALAHHTDIGVAQWRLPIELDWLDWLIGKLGSSQLPRSMHVESIVWAALAMRLGGGYLNPKQWLCWHRSQYKRLRLKLGATGVSILSKEDFSTLKCFHAGGEAKWWLQDALKSGFLDGKKSITSSSGFLPFVELTPTVYKSLQGGKKLLRQLGYYSLFGQS
jgi:hypothetical protein